MPVTTHPIRYFSWFVGLCLAASAPAAAQQTPNGAAQPFTGEVTVTATGMPTPVEEAPTAVTVITREEIDDALADTVAEMLRRVPGLTVVGSGDEGKLTSVFTRGTNSNQTLVMLDGVRLNSPYFGGFDWSAQSTAGLGRVEVVRGPYSALWGADAVGGVINLLPQRARGGFAGQVFGEGGSDGWRRIEGNIGWGGRSFDVSVAGFDREGDGGLENSDFATRGLLGTAGWSWGQRGHRIGVVMQDIRAESGIPYATPGDPTPQRRQRSDQTLVAVPLQLFLGDAWNLELNGAMVGGDFEFEDPDDPWFTSSHTTTSSLQARVASHHQLRSHVLSWGGDWHEDEVDDASNLGSNLDAARTTVASVFVQDVWGVSPRLHLLVGARWDDADEWGSEMSPRADVRWRASERLELRAGYGEAFRPPSIGELYFPFSGNPALEPETSRSSDLGLVYTTRSGASRWQLAAYATNLDNLIEFDFATYTNANIGAATIRGVELSWQRRLGSRAQSVVELTYLDTEDGQGRPLLRRPEWSASWTAHGSASDRLSGDLTLLWVGARADVDPVTFARAEAGAYLTADLAAAYSLAGGVAVTLRVTNIADVAYEEVLGYPSPGRRFMAGLRFGFWKAARP